MVEKTQDSLANQSQAKVATPLGLSLFFLVAANLVPLLGALFWGWRVFDIVVLYWIENVIVGFLNAIRMLMIRNGGTGGLHLFGKIFQIGFFLFHYGVFTLVHGVFVFTLLGGGFGVTKQEVDIPLLLIKLKWAVLALVISHVFSLLYNFIGKQEYKKSDLQTQMMAPYPRMIALHVAIVFGAFAVEALGQPVVLLAILVVGKTIADCKLHVKSHRKLAEKPVTT